MSTQHKKTPGSHYSGTNPVPNIQRFVENLDSEKKERDRKIDEESKAKRGQRASAKDGIDVKDHEAKQPTGVPRSRKTVTDPTTGKQVQIEDVNADFMGAVDNPKLSVPNGNVGKEATVKAEVTQSGNEYRRNQDITAPPDPVEPGSTSDVPIHGEKTNILFYPTPSVSFEPMYDSIEKRTWGLVAGVAIAIVMVGKMFGGAIYGLIPLAMCVASGIFLWMKEIVRQGRALEWQSEKDRGEHATVNLIPESVEWMNSLLGITWGLINPDMFVSVAD